MTHAEADKQFREIGQYVISTYGAELEDWEIDQKTGNIILYAIECGERFYCEITPRDWSQYARECGAI